MAVQSVDQHPFEPIFEKDAVLENLSAENCRKRDFNRRIGALICTRTADELAAAAATDPATMIEMARAVEDLRTYCAAETDVMRAAVERIAWALELQGVTFLPAQGRADHDRADH